MSESFNAESISSVEQAKFAFEKSIFEFSDAARAFGKFEVGREAEVDGSVAELLQEKKEVALKMFEAYLASLEQEAVAEGVASRQGELI